MISAAATAAAIRAGRLRAAYRTAALRVFDEVDVLLLPATLYVAPTIGQEMIEVEGERIPVRPNLGVFTQPISCIGLLAHPGPRLAGRVGSCQPDAAAGLTAGLSAGWEGRRGAPDLLWRLRPQ